MPVTTNLDDDHCRYVIEKYNHAVVHLRQQVAAEHFGLVFGAGIGIDLGFPRWPDLLQRIAKHEDVNGTQIATSTGTASTSLAQHLYQHYRTSRVSEATDNERGSNMLEMQIRAGWRRVIRECLYAEVPADMDDLLKKDRYLESLVPLMQKAALTVTYNFDDTLQRLLKRCSKEDDLGSATYWSGNVQLLAKKGGVIYHPNGFLPRKSSEKPSDHLVLLEDSFVDQVIDSMAGHYAALATHIGKNTCLFIGLSLDDPGLKHLLRQNAKAFPGQFHYYVRFVRDPLLVNDALQKVESDANFEVYNLITLHLTAEQIKALAQLLAAPHERYAAVAEPFADNLSFHYYAVGSVSAGKSTTVSHFRSLVTQQEWAEERAAGMEKAPDLLSDAERAKIDEWVANQIGIKNRRLTASSVTGLHVIDRAPLDAFAFTPPGEPWEAKAARLRTAIGRGKAKRTLQKGHIIFLRGDPAVMAERAVSLHKDTTRDKLELQQDELLIVYRGVQPAEGFTEIDTRGKSVGEVVKSVARVIFRTPYVAADLDARLQEFESKGKPGEPLAH